jgi:phage tail sheath protein FI
MSTTTQTALPSPLNTPGVYIQEIPVLPASIVSVLTAVPVFVGYTQMATEIIAGDLHRVPFMVDNIVEYQQYFGLAYPETGLEATVNDTLSPPSTVVTLNEKTRSPYLMFYSLQMYFANGGAPCYIMSIGTYNKDNPVISISDYKGSDGITFCPELQKYNDITLVVLPDSLSIAHTDTSTTPDLGGTAYYQLQSLAIDHCILMQNRMAVMDIYPIHGYTSPIQNINVLRGEDTNNKGLGITGAIPEDYKFAAAYYPRLYTSITPSVKDPTTLQDNDSLIKVTLTSTGTTVTLDTLKSKQGQLYYSVKNYIANNLEMLLPAAPAVVGVYANVDNNSGVWTAPANRNIAFAVDLEQHISATDQGPINVDPATGLSVNVIRSFPGRGPAIIWGARTLAGNDNEWRYIPVRRFFFMVEQSIKNAIEPFVFATNDSNTWTRVKAMIGNYLTGLWKQGALMGGTAKDSFYVYVGLGETMVETDILEGRMIVKIGMAVVRPAEFIILQFMQLMQSPS